MSGLDYPKITITGDIGSGKSAIAKLLSEKLNYKIYSTGLLQRKIAEQLGMSTLELNKYADLHPEIDQQMDNFSKSIRDRQESCIVDSRMAWFIIPEAFKLYLQVDTDVAAKRILSDIERKSEVYVNLEETRKNIVSRRASEVERYSKRYGVDLSDRNNYDLTLNTSSDSPEEIVKKIINSYNSWLSIRSKK